MLENFPMSVQSLVGRQHDERNNTSADRRTTVELDLLPRHYTGIIENKRSDMSTA